MKTNVKKTMWLVPTAAAAALCIGLGADVLRSADRATSITDGQAVPANPAAAVSHFTQSSSAANKNRGSDKLSVGSTDGSIAEVPTSMSKGAAGVPADRRASQGPQQISGNASQTITFDVTGIESINAVGDALNEVFQLNIGANAHVIGVGWDVTIEAFEPSWLSEMLFRFTNNSDPISAGVNLTVGVGDDEPGVESYSSDGILNLANLDLAFQVDADGILRLEFFESFVDFDDEADGVWLSGELTFEYVPAGAPCPADLNNDGVVNVSDLLILLGDWGSCPGCDSDLNNDGVVNVSDLLILLGDWGSCPPAADFTGACCFDDFGCMDRMSEDDCLAADGEYGGDFTDCGFCPQAPDGETCITALPIGIDSPVTVDTTGNEIGIAPQCGGVQPNQPTAWFSIVGNGTQLTAEACQDDFDESTTVAVYCGFCDNQPAPLTCNAGGGDAVNCPNSFFDGSATWCATEEVTYFIAVWRSTPGEVTVTVTEGNACESQVDCFTIAEPVCELDDINCQAGPTGGTWASSDIVIEDIQDPPAGGVFRADDFTAAETGNITSVCWQGVELELGGGGIIGACPESGGQGQQFQVTYYSHDPAGRPGDVMAGPFVGTPEFSRIGFVTFAAPIGDAGHIDYTMEHPPVAVEEGTCYWIEIVALTPTGGCAFFWKPSPEGNGQVFSKTGDAEEYPEAPTAGFTNPDRHFCVNIELGDADQCLPPIGACCVGVSCTQESFEDCAAADGCFFAGQDCANVTCIFETYNIEGIDCEVNIGAIQAGGGTIVWATGYDVIAGAETISHIAVGINSGVPAGEDVNWAIYDTTNVPNNTPAVRSGVAESLGTNVTVPISVDPVEITSGRFWIVTWVEYPAGTAPASYNADVTAPSGTTYASLTAPPNADSVSGLAELSSLNPDLTGVWRHRAD